MINLHWPGVIIVSIFSTQVAFNNFFKCFTGFLLVIDNNARILLKARVGQ